MKNLLVLLTLLAMSATISARPPHERGGSDGNTGGIEKSISTNVINEIDNEIFNTRKYFEAEEAMLSDSPSFVEGKHIAAMIDSIERGLQRVIAKRAALEGQSEIEATKNAGAILMELEEIKELIEELRI